MVGESLRGTKEVSSAVRGAHMSSSLCVWLSRSLPVSVRRMP